MKQFFLSESRKHGEDENLRGYIGQLNNGEQTCQICYIMLTLLTY